MADFSSVLGVLLAALVAAVPFASAGAPAVPSPRQAFGFEPGADRELFAFSPQGRASTPATYKLPLNGLLLPPVE
jgi:hypothetical protein